MNIEIIIYNFSVQLPLNTYTPLFIHNPQAGLFIIINHTLIYFINIILVVLVPMKIMKIHQQKRTEKKKGDKPIMFAKG